MVAFLAMSFLSLSSVSIDMNGHMTNCPFMGDSSSFCQMTLVEHLNRWQQSFMMTREKSSLLSLSFLLIALYIFGFTVTIKTRENLKYQRLRKYYYRYKPEIKLFDNLALAFSDGLIHPKIYA